MRHRRRSPRRSNVAGKRSRRWRSDERSSDGDTSSWRRGGLDERRVQRSVRDCRLPMSWSSDISSSRPRPCLPEFSACRASAARRASRAGRVLAGLDRPDLLGSIQPGEIFRLCWQVLDACGDPRATEQPKRPAATSGNLSPRSATMTCASRSSGRSRPTSRLLLGGLETTPSPESQPNGRTGSEPSQSIEAFQYRVKTSSMIAPISMTSRYPGSAPRVSRSNKPCLRLERPPRRRRRSQRRGRALCRRRSRRWRVRSGGTRSPAASMCSLYTDGCSSVGWISSICRCPA